MLIGIPCCNRYIDNVLEVNSSKSDSPGYMHVAAAKQDIFFSCQKKYLQIRNPEINQTLSKSTVKAHVSWKRHLVWHAVLVVTPMMADIQLNTTGETEEVEW